MTWKTISVNNAELVDVRDNPTVSAVGYNDDIIKSQISIQPLGGNISYQQKRWEIDDTPIPKKKHKDVKHLKSLTLTLKNRKTPYGL